MIGLRKHTARTRRRHGSKECSCGTFSLVAFLRLAVAPKGHGTACEDVGQPLPPSHRSRLSTRHSRLPPVIPAPITSIQSLITSFPSPSRHSRPHHIAPASHPVIPAPITSFPSPSRHSRPHPVIPVSHPVIPVSHPVIPVSRPSFPRRRESLRPVSGRRIHGNTISPRKVTGCIRRMVGGWRVQIPAYAGMTLWRAG